MSLKSVLTFCFTLILGLSLYAQDSEEKFEEIELKSAKKMTRNAQTPEGATKLVGNVVFGHKNSTMYCDSAYLYENNSLHAFGHVKIVDGDSLTMTGDSLLYDGNTELAKIRGHVVIDNKSSILKTKFLDYDKAKGVATYYGGGEIDSRTEKIHLVSRRGSYFSENKLFHFKKDVVMTHPDYVIETDTMHYSSSLEKTWFYGPTDITFENRHIYCERGWFDQIKDHAVFIKHAKIDDKGQTLMGDTIEYFEKSQLGIGRMNVLLIDSNEKFEVVGDYGIYNKADSTTLITKNMMMKQDMDGDTFFLVADTMRSVVDTSGQRVIKTYHDARFFKSDMQGKCDSLVYLTKDSIIHMFRNPILWSDESQITADSIYMTMKTSKLDRMYMNKNAFIVSKDDSIYFNQIKGDDMIGYFIEQELKKVDVFGNGQTIYYPREEGNNLIGVNETKCNNMTIKIDSNKIKQITFFDQPTSLLTPSDDMPAIGKTLENFTYRVDEKPKSVEDLKLNRKSPAKKDLTQKSETSNTEAATEKAAETNNSGEATTETEDSEKSKFSSKAEGKIRFKPKSN